MTQGECDAVIVGAGAAGLAAARRLAAHSRRVAVLEARDRVGGRAFSVPATRALTPAELGAEFIHGRGALTQALLREEGMASVQTRGESWRCNADGRLERDDQDFLSVAAIFEAAGSLPKDESVESFLRRYERDDARAARAARDFVEGFDAADPGIASARAIAEEWRSGTDLRSARPIGGYAPIFDRLRRDCVASGVSLQLTTPVRRIRWRPGGVELDAAGADGERRFAARAAIVTLPAGVLRHRGDGSVTFAPDLPAAKRDALAKIETGDVVKVALAFHAPFWEWVGSGRYRNAAFFRCDRSPFAVYWTQLPVRSELIVAWIGGPRATALCGTQPDELVSRARDDFGALLGAGAECRSAFEAGFMHDWHGDPFSRGAYSYITVGGERARAALAEPLDDTLFFAGEATSADGQGGTVNGALETGERAATEVEACLKRRS